MLSTIATSALGFSAKDLAAGAKRANVKAQASDFCYGLPGNIAPVGDFDPANFLEGKSKLEVMRLREAEITAGNRFNNEYEMFPFSRFTYASRFSLSDAQSNL